MAIIRNISDSKGPHGDLDSRRIFFAIDLPEDTVKAAEDLFKTFSGIPKNFISWVKSTNLHITLKFLGPVQQKKIPDICSAARRAFASIEPMELMIEGMGIFPNHDRPRVVWLGVKGDTDKLASLESALSKELEPLGFPPDQRPFVAHLTIGRVKNENVRGRLIRLVREYHETRIGPAPVAKITLYESMLSAKGAAHTALDSFPL